jgi:TM2 domain-containing membrane protein YozV
VDASSGAWEAALRRQADESSRKWSTALTLSVLLGLFGADRLYLGFGVLGVIKLCTFGGLCWWWIIDVLLLLTRRMKDADGKTLR